MQNVNPVDHHFNFEAALTSFSRNKTGCFVRIEIAQHEVPPQLADATPGQRYYCVLTPMPDDMPEPSPRDMEEGKRAVMEAGMACKNSDFQAFLGATTEGEAIDIVRENLRVVSRRDLMTNPAARKAWRLLYDEYLGV